MRSSSVNEARAAVLVDDDRPVVTSNALSDIAGSTACGPHHLNLAHDVATRIQRALRAGPSIAHVRKPMTASWATGDRVGARRSPASLTPGSGPGASEATFGTSGDTSRTCRPRREHVVDALPRPGQRLVAATCAQPSSLCCRAGCAGLRRAAPPVRALTTRDGWERPRCVDVARRPSTRLAAAAPALGPR